jgi:DNA-binding GntR family transcriptional regulator
MLMSIAAGEPVALGRLDGDQIRTAQSAVKTRLRRGIISGEIPAGTRLVQADLAKMLAVSVTPVREAIRDLVAEGIVDFDQFRGATVHLPTLAELEEVYELRRLLVPVAVRSGVEQITPAEVAAASSLAVEMKTTTNPAAWLDLNRRFHALLDGSSRQPHLQDFLERLADISALYVGVSISGNEGRRSRADRDHLQMVDMFRTGDTAGAVEVSLFHLEDTVQVARSSALLREDAVALTE